MQPLSANQVITGAKPRLLHEEFLFRGSPAAHCNTPIAHLTYFRPFC
jgi:hypothetical protein